MRKTIVFITLLAACNANDLGSDGKSAAFYSGPSLWTAQLNVDQTFILLHFPGLGQITADQLIDGTFSGAGVMPLSVTASAGTGQPSEGAQGSALQAPGALFVLNPFSSGPLIPMVPRGNCPSSALLENLIKVQATSTDNLSATFTFDPASGVATLSEQPLGSGACTDGIVTTSDGAVLFLTDGGPVIIQSGDEIYFGLPGTETPSEDYTALVYDAAAAPTNTTVRLTSGPDPSLTCIAQAPILACAGPTLTLFGVTPGQE